MYEVLEKNHKKQLKAVTWPNLTAVPACTKETPEKNLVQPFQSIRDHYRSDSTDQLCFLNSMPANPYSIAQRHTAAIGKSSNIIQKAPIEVAEKETKETGIHDPVIFPGLDSCLGITVKIGEKIHAAHLVMPFDTEGIEIYSNQVNTIYQLYFAAPKENRALHISYKSDATIFGSNPPPPTNSHHEVLEHISNLEQFKSMLKDNITPTQAEINDLLREDSEIEEIIRETEELIRSKDLLIEPFVKAIKMIDTCIFKLNTLKEEEASYTFGLQKNSEGTRQTGDWQETRSRDDVNRRWLNTVTYHPLMSHAAE